MVALSGGGEIVLVSVDGGPPSGCAICSRRRGTSGESTSNGTPCFARVKGGNGAEVCGDCLAKIKALAP